MKIKGSVALITGGCGGLGLPVATYLKELGAEVIIADRTKELGETLPFGFDYFAFDATKPAEAKEAVSQIAARYGKIEILVNCAGRISSAPFVNFFDKNNLMLSYEKFRDDLTVNLDTVFIVSSAVVEQMVIKRSSGVIINISSICAVGNEGQTAYSAAKAGVNAMTVTWSKELAKLGIRCNAVAPGFIGTASTGAALNENQLKHIVANTPLRRLGTELEVAKAVAALIDNDFLNGVILEVSGGIRI